MKIKTRRVLTHLDIDWTEWSPYTCLVDDGKIEEREMIKANNDIINTIVDCAALLPFIDAYKRMVKKLDDYSHLGFADSEGFAVLDEICREIWGQEAVDYLGE